MNKTSNKKSLSEKVIFLFPSRIIKDKHLSKKDVGYVKDNVADNLTVIRIITAAVVFILSFLLTTLMQAQTSGNQSSVYGTTSLISQVVSMTGCLICIILEVTATMLRKKSNYYYAGVILRRIAANLLFATMATQLFLGLYSDAEMGYTTQKEALSASIIFVTLLVLIQPSYWLDAMILDVSFSIVLFVVSFHCYSTFGMKALHYYGLVAILFPLVCYMIVSLLFYAECQHYRDLLEKERLTDKAYYDNLTLCKNRHSLSEFIKNNAKRWETKQDINLLIILFDIDNFKQYNDQFSHLGGDYCLRSIADAVRKEFPAPSLDFFRYGGEEFLLFFELPSFDDASVTIERVRKAVWDLKLEAPKGAPEKTVTISLGGLFIRNIDNFDFEDQMNIVDKYLYIAKASGKNVSCFNGELINRR
jgi:diguanylate cyclase (GGDEF)-like protein